MNTDRNIFLPLDDIVVYKRLSFGVGANMLFKARARVRTRCPNNLHTNVGNQYRSIKRDCQGVRKCSSPSPKRLFFK